MLEQKSDAYIVVHMTLEQIKQKLADLSSLDLSKIHIGHEWTWMPYVKDHLDFLVEQISGLTENLQDAPPPETPEEIQSIKKRDYLTEDK